MPPTSEPGSPATPGIAIPDGVARMVGAADRIVALTGAGVSAESGVPTFRDARAGLWARFDPMTLATPEAFAENPARVWAWYRWRMHLMAGVTPNAGHRALARLADTIVTQNVDDLHERGGSPVVHHLHGSLSALRCSECDDPYPHRPEPMPEPVEELDPPECPRCGAYIRPDIVWFGEYLPQAPWEAAVRDCTTADLVLLVGTSGIVRPAAELPLVALDAGIPVIEVNPDETPLSGLVTERLRGPAASILPALADAAGNHGRSRGVTRPHPDPTPVAPDTD